MVQILEIAAGVFLGLFAFVAFWEWREDRRIERQIENQIRGLTTDQVRMLQGIRDPAELTRIISNMQAANEAERNLRRLISN
jgi:predicted membrane chloride channel (bestrophin family)